MFEALPGRAYGNARTNVFRSSIVSPGHRPGKDRLSQESARWRHGQSQKQQWCRLRQSETRGGA